MKSRNLLRSATLATALALCAGLAGLASADKLYTWSWSVTATVPAGQSVDDLHLYFNDGAKTIKNVVLSSPAGSANANGNFIDVSLDAKLGAGQTVTLTFVTNHLLEAPDFIDDAVSTWTFEENTVANVAEADVAVTQLSSPNVPGASPIVLIALALLMVGMGAFVLRRRAELA